MIRGNKNPIVHVIAYRKDAKAPLQLIVTPDPLDMTQYTKSSQTITWVIDTKGYHFPLQGPSIEFTSADWEKSFSDLKVSRDGKRVSVHNENRDGLAFAYNVHVVEKSSGTTACLDPVIQNNDW